MKNLLFIITFSAITNLGFSQIKPEYLSTMRCTDEKLAGEIIIDLAESLASMCFRVDDTHCYDMKSTDQGNVFEIEYPVEGKMQKSSLIFILRNEFSPGDLIEKRADGTELIYKNISDNQ